MWECLLSPETKTNFFSLLNELAGDYVIRGYLAQNKDLVEVLVNCILSQEPESDILQNAVGILQKLSLKVEAQDLMVSKGIIKAVFALLENKKEKISEYILEYSLALLMNLSLNPKAKIIIEEDVNLAYINSLMAMWETCPQSIRHFLNATVYSFLWSPAIQAKAKHAKLDERVKEGSELLEENLQTQIEYIIKRINGESNEETMNSGKDIIDIDGLDIEIIEQILHSEFVLNPDLEKFVETYSTVLQQTIDSKLEILKHYFEGFMRTFNEMISFNITSEPLDRHADNSMAMTGKLSYTDKPITPIVFNDKFSTFSYSQISELNQADQTPANKRKYIRSRFGNHRIQENENGETTEWEKGFQSKVIKVQRTPLIK
jgi:hypothetical protein